MRTRRRFSVRVGAALLALAMGCSSGGGTVAPDAASLPEANAGDYAPDATAPAAVATPSASGPAGPAATAAPPSSGPAAVRATGSAPPRTGGPSGPSGPRATAAATTGPRPSAKATATNAPAKRLWVDTKCRQNASWIGDGAAVKGQRPPDFTGTTTDCKRLEFSAFTKGRPTLVNFYATWCKPCHEEAKDMQDLYEEWHPENGFTIVAVLTKDAKGDPTDFYTKHGWTFPTVWDDNDAIVNAYDRKSAAVGTLPVSFWIHSDGTVSEIHIGGMSREQMQQHAEKLR